MSNFVNKKTVLQELLADYVKKDVVLAFSGGVDSSLLLQLVCNLARETGTKVYAVTMHTKLHPTGDLEIAKQVAQEAGAIHQVIYVDELKEAGIEDNPTDRCYRCKKVLFQKILDFANELDTEMVLEGTNEDDLHGYRPGLRALEELGVVSPLAKARFTKAEVRQYATELNISVANRPATPCLATRFPYGTKLDYGIMRRVEKGEQKLREMGFLNVRLRVHGDVVRVELDLGAIARAVSQREQLVEMLRKLGFVYITLDLEGFRSGSMDK